ncbi:hypothetical protein QTH91_00895 [Variovorax dokdonensis]|uniref:Uncharacterized protein n=1 Tax=Variovorax dokdonensis TaxID=344883 RepID=A0ABT7N504_9BURK|nr:hypothetical protein [Variovorax dokdonensis]MDM0043026.1 hypothetical protein [Variovorax dokdonensis]
MSSPGLRISGPKPDAYVLGEPLDVFDGDLHLGRLNSIQVGAGGGTLHLDDFRTTDLKRLQTWRTARLIVVEILSYLVDRHPSVSAFDISLSADVEALDGTEGGARRLAQARMQMLHSVGTTEIRMVPKPHPRHSAHFVVRGVWYYNADNAQALAHALNEERQGFAQRKIDAAQAEPVTAPPPSMIARLLAKERHKP